MRVLIADDELMARKRLQRLLGAMPDVTLVGSCCDGREVLAQLDGVDLILLDIHMPHLTGVEALGMIGEDGPTVIFTTAHPNYAIEAFEGGAIDYLLKPVEASRLKRALDRARSRLQARDTITASGVPPNRLPLQTRKGVVLIDIDTISHAVIDGVSVVVHAGEQRYLTDLRLADLARKLPAESFLRVHRQALIHTRFLERLEPVDSGGYIAHLRGGAAVAVSRQVARELRRRWDLPR